MNKNFVLNICFHAVFLSFLFSSLSGFAAAADNKLVRVGVYDSKPLVFKDGDGKYQGITIDLLNEVARKKQWRIKYIPGSWAENLNRLSDGSIDLLVAIAWSGVRSQIYQFNKTVVLSSWAQIYSTANNDIHSILSLDGKTVAMVKKDIHSLAFIDLVKKFNLKVAWLPVNSYADSLQAIAAGKADAALTNRLYDSQLIQQYKLVKTPVVFNPVEIHYAAPLTGSGDLLRDIDSVLTALKGDQNSVYYRSIEHWISGEIPAYSQWIWKTLQVVSFMLLLAVCVILYARWQVRVKTRELEGFLNKEKNLRRALEESENKFRLSFKTSLDSINLNKLDGTYVEINKGFQRILGYNFEEVIGKTSTELGIWKDISDLDKLVSALKQTGSITNFEADFVHKDGSIVSGLMSANIVEINNEQHILSVTRDIGVFKKQQQALQQADELWQQTFDAMGDIITVQDADMSILRGNRAAREFYGSDTFVGQFCFFVAHGLSVPCQNCLVKETFLDGVHHAERIYHAEKDKTFAVTTHPILHEKGRVMQVVRVAKDITDQMAKEQERLLLSRAIKQSTDSIVITDVAGDIEYVNPAFERLSGYNRLEVLGQNPRLLQSGQHNQAFYRELWQTILAGNTWRGIFINQKKNGELYHEKSTISPVKNSDSKLTHFIAVKQNVTHERELEQQLRQAQKLEAIGTLAGGIAHDFNNILGVILGFAQMAVKELPEASAAKQDIAEIVIAGRRAADLVKQILTFSRQENEEFKPLSVQLVVKETLKLLKASLPATIHLEQTIDTSCKPIYGDPTQLHQVLLNLCTNAKHALHEAKGTISVSLQQRNMGLADGKNISSKPTGVGYVDIEVTDNGCGMDGQTMARVFDPFFTTRAKGQGTGLGLAVSYGIIKQHGGEIIVTSVPGEGTTFHISLPTIASEVELALADKHETPPRGTEHIVLVDDEKTLIDITERILTGLGYTVTSFTDSQYALTWMQNHIAEFDLLLTDMTMPEITGADLAEQLLALRPELPVVLCTGFSEVLSEEQAAELGIRAYLPKPATKLQMAKKLNMVLHP